MKCSFTITVFDECDDFIRLSLLLQQFMLDGDELIITNNPSTESLLIKQFAQQNLRNFKYYEYPLDEIAKQDTFTKSKCNNDIIFGLCPDEMPSPLVLLTFRKIVEQGYDAIFVPRMNLYTNLTLLSLNTMYKGERPNECYIEGWTEYGYRWPDYQRRIFRNVDYITYGPKSHDGLIGYKNPILYPAEPKFAITHIKSIERQSRKNKLDDESI